MISSFISGLYLCRLPGEIWLSLVTAGYDPEDGPPYEERLKDIDHAEEFLDFLNHPPERLSGIDDLETIVQRAAKLAPRLARETGVLLADQRRVEAEEQRLAEVERAKQEQVELAAAVEWARRQGLGDLSPAQAGAACLEQARKLAGNVSDRWRGLAIRGRYLELLGLPPFDSSSRLAAERRTGDGPSPFASLDDRRVIDALVEAVATNDHELAAQLADVVASRDHLLDMQHTGILRTIDDVESLEFIERILHPSPERLAQLEDGAVLTGAERRRILKTVTDDEFQADGNADAWAIDRVEGGSDACAYVATTVSGGGSSGIERSVVGVFTTFEEAKAALQELGYLDADDFKTRYSR